MQHKLPFTFANKSCSCDVYLDITPDSRFVFIALLNPELVDKFGTYVTIETDFEQCLPRADDYDELVELRQAVFNSVKILPEFIAAKESTFVAA